MSIVSSERRSSLSKICFPISTPINPKCVNIIYHKGAKNISMWKLDKAITPIKLLETEQPFAHIAKRRGSFNPAYSVKLLPHSCQSTRKSAPLSQNWLSKLANVRSLFKRRQSLPRNAKNISQLSRRNISNNINSGITVKYSYMLQKEEPSPQLSYFNRQENVILPSINYILKKISNNNYGNKMDACIGTNKRPTNLNFEESEISPWERKSKKKL